MSVAGADAENWGGELTSHNASSVSMRLLRRLLGAGAVPNPASATDRSLS